ncbi:MAG: sulfatase-like hydrolase/transferase [Planctomycetota bacterium]|jgi:choline-sulfatase|nr:sulfatase-like hydrolase/transferase [Planctomycetota bacterium]MDP7133214.1 sulfatase-like hydrolase/transferase [Planctomycetota bacterium]MDP7251353.1 sulfatase-like hydrolase/transferase [Planctomycetota bacterium]
MPDQPNILWICSDQQRFDTLGCYGNSFVQTPHIDRLAEDGVLFENAFCQSPICTPSRASFLTGRYPRTTRARQNGQNIPSDETLVTKLLADAGYTCGLSGKLHISACNPRPCPDMERRIDDGYHVFNWSHHPSPDWPGSEYGLWLQERGVEYKTPPYNDSKHVRTGMPSEHHQTTWCAQKAIDFMERSSKTGRPWLFSVNIFDPHFAFDPPAEYLERYLDLLDEIPLPNYVEGELDSKPRYQSPEFRDDYHHPGPHHFEEMSDEEHRLVTAAYWAMCDLIDEQVGRMLEALDRTGQRENTIVIYMSDHGEMLGDHSIYLKGPYFYEPAVKVPLIVSWPGRIESDRRTNALVELMDLAPTLLDAAGLPRYPGMQSKSLWSLLTEDDSDLSHHHDTVYSEYYHGMQARVEPAPFATMLRSERYKIVVAHGLETGELYDLREDPTETRNLWDDAAHSDTKMSMLKQLCDRMAFTADPLPERIGPW